ncbi:MAG TPA: hypothetical protein ENH10_03435 [Bacteroidetes bacterium]|nr:hypothetical protein [Bacteroidota bacterium]HEX04194.1 hypothetical protein [Bacteroidota bacterium]
MSVRKALSLCAVLGFVVWLAITVAFRFTGHLFFNPENTGVIVGLFVGVVPVMMLLTFSIYLILRIPPSGHSPASIAIALPGLLLDSAVFPLYSVVFPNVDPATDGLYAGLALLAYASILLTPYLFRKKKKKAI